MNFNRLLVFVFFIIFTLACSSSKEATSDTNSSDQEVYVFDDVSDVNDVPEESTTTAISHEAIEVSATQKVVTPPPTPALPPQLVEDGYVVQVGAFSTKEKAENFLRDAENKIKYKLSIIQSEKSGFFVVQLSPFESREAAEKARNELWTIPKFKDAFIVPK